MFVKVDCDAFPSSTVRLQIWPSDSIVGATRTTSGGWGTDADAARTAQNRKLRSRNGTSQFTEGIQKCSLFVDGQVREQAKDHPQFLKLLGTGRKLAGH